MQRQRWKVSWRTHTKEVCEGDDNCQLTTKFKSKHASQQKERSKGQLQLSKSLQAMAARCEDSDSSRHKEGPSGTMQGASVRMHVTRGFSNLLSALMLLVICIIATFTCVLPNLPLNPPSLPSNKSTRRVWKIIRKPIDVAFQCVTD
jgi:hypothetical protein